MFLKFSTATTFNLYALLSVAADVYHRGYGCIRSLHHVCTEMMHGHLKMTSLWA
jgi:hypothetical protein